MATVEAEPFEDALGRIDDALAAVGLQRIHLAIAGITLFALALRLYDLGARAAHWDEGRVAYWTLQFIETGNFKYRPIIHGPFYHHVNKALYTAFGATDVTMRIVVAVITGLTPLSVLALRGRLRDIELVTVALFLTANPTILYYSRFMRGDPLVATFMFAAFALFVGTIDSGRRSYFVGGVALVALALTAKENALIYLVTWAGATGLLLDRRLLFARSSDRDWVLVLREHLLRAGRAVKRWWRPLLLAPVEVLVIIVYFYAPRRATDSKVGLWEAFEHDLSVGTISEVVVNINLGLLQVPDVVEEATVGSWKDFYGLWVSGGHQSHAYLPYLGDFLQTMQYGALMLSLFAVVGFVADRYAGSNPRDVVAFCFYWGFVSVLGYPIVTDIKAPWATVNAVVPLAVPAGIGIALVVRWAISAYDREKFVDAGLAVVLLLLVAGQVGTVGYSAVYVDHSEGDNELVQFAQPGSDVRPFVETLRRSAPRNDGADVVLYGDYYAERDAHGTRDPKCVKWFNALPLPWYFETTDAAVACARDQESLSRLVERDQSPVVIARSNVRDIIDDELTNYQGTYYSFRAWGTNSTVFVHEEWAGVDTEINVTSDPPGPTPTATPS